MLNIGNKIRFGHQIYNVLKIKNDDILIENNNIVNCISKEELKNNLQKISFKKPSNLTESFKLLNEKLNVSLVYENDYVKIIARPIFEGFGASIYYHGSDEKNIKEFNTKSIFWTSEIEFAKNWGKYIYKAQLDIGKCFIFNERSHFNWLLKKVGKFSYEDANGNEQYFTNYNEYIKSPLKDNNWEIVEDYTDIIKTAYNSMQVTENGTKNYAVFENKQIKLIGNATPRNLDEGYVQRKSEFANTGVMFDDDYIEFEVGMSYIDENNIKWTITDIKTDADGDQICIVESEDGRYDRISALILNIDMFDLDTKKPVFDEKYFKQEDIKKANNISEHSEIIIYTNDKKYTKIYECNKLDAIKNFTSKFNFYNALVPQYLIKNGFLEESIHHASQWKDEQGDDVFFTILKNPTRKEFNDLLKNSKHKQLRAIVGPHFNDDIYVWDAYYGTHDDIFRRYIYPVDKKFRDGFANVMFRKNDYDIWGFTFSDWFNKLGYNSKDNSTNTIPKEKWEELYADDDLGLLDESNNLKYNQTIVSEEDKQEFLQILAKHRQLVNYYASKVGKNYPNHDLDKLKPDMFIPYVKGFVIGKQSLNPNEWKEFKNTQDKHYKQASHHSQFWDKSWTHDGQIPDVCGKMPDDAIIEMCADWCAMSKKYGNTPFEWADENINKLWKFDKHQINLIYKTLHKMWDNSINESSWYGNVNWQNNMDALGNVPATIGHNLFATMYPFQFLKLCPKYSYGDDEWFDKQIDERKPYGIPFLKVDVDEKNKKLIVTNHEGRHRVASVKRKEPNVDIPVAILYNKDRYILPDIKTLRKEWFIVSQDGNTEFKVGQFSLYNELPKESGLKLYNIYKDKQINESIFYKGDFYDDWTEENKYLTIWKNPSAEWIKNSFSKTAYGAFRFFYNSFNKTLFIWDADEAVHGVINNDFDVDGDIAGTLCDNNEVLIWIYISPDEDFEDAVRITKEKFGWFLKQLYGNLDNIKWGIND